MNCFTDEQLNRITHLIREIERLSDAEKLFLYLQLPGAKSENSDGKSKFNGTKSNSDMFSKKPDQETTQTYTWILSHLEVDPNVSLPKQEVYDEYRAFCQANRFEPLCVADFGKAMKHAFPCIKPRRLGQRGNSRYCYSGLRKKYRIQPPNLPDMIEPTFCIDNDCSQAYNQIIESCHDYPEDCPIMNPSDLPNFNNGVMNLKVEPGSIGNNEDDDTNNNNNNHSNGLPANNHFNSTGKVNPDMMAEQHQRVGSVSATTSAPSAQLVLAADQHFVQSSSMLPTQTSSRFNYNFIQQPGSPDDDDYRHNYQDIGNCLPISGQLLNFASSFPPTPSSGPPSVGGFVNNCAQIGEPKTPQQSSSSDANNNGTTSSNSNRQQSSSAANHLVFGTNRASMIPTSEALAMPSQQQVINFVSAPANATTHHQHHHHHHHLVTNLHQHNNPEAHHNHFISQMGNSTHFESCASPFQSPASTPYPMMANSSLNQQEMQDYYSNNDFVRYSSS